MTEPSATPSREAGAELSWSDDIEERPTRVMVIGLGTLGSRIVDGLMRTDGEIGMVIAAGRDTNEIRPRANLSLFSAMQTAPTAPSLECVRIDLSDPELSVEVFSRLQPDVIVNCATMQPYRSIAALSPRKREHLEAAGLGPWLATHLALADRLMQAVEMLGVQPHVVNCAYPDAVNPALAVLGRPPLVGAGNVGNNEPAIRRIIADWAGANPAAVRLAMVMHHYVSHRIHRMGDSGGAPFYLSFKVEDDTPHAALGAEDIFERLASSYPRAQGTVGRLMPAAAAVAIVRGLLGERARVLHAPGPIGHVGGMPISLSRQRLALALPSEISITQATAINAGGQRHDGIDEIKASGEVTFTESARSELRQAIGHDLESFRIEEAWELASELVIRARQSADQ